MFTSKNVLSHPDFLNLFKLCFYSKCESSHKVAFEAKQWNICNLKVTCKKLVVVVDLYPRATAEWELPIKTYYSLYNVHMLEAHWIFFL